MILTFLCRYLANHFHCFGMMVFLSLLFSLIGASLQQQNDETVYIPVRPSGNFSHFQSFLDENWKQNYFISKKSQFQSDMTVKESGFIENDKMLFTEKSNSKYLLSTKFSSPIDLSNSTLAIQFEVVATDQNSNKGVYAKLYNEEIDLSEISESTPFVVRFGPEFTSPYYNVRFSFYHKYPTSDSPVEHTLRNCPRLKYDHYPHLYTLIVRPDNTFEILVDGYSHIHGSLLEDFIPPVNPPKEIPDPDDKKPKDWVENELIVDKNAQKPDDWDENLPEFIPESKRLNPPEGWLPDEPEFIPDPSFEKPAEWDDKFFGDWVPPLIENPKCKIGCGKYIPPSIKNPDFKGRWIPPKVKNPEYRGKWTPRLIPNPNYVNDKTAHDFGLVSSLGFHIQTGDGLIGINNILISTEESTLHNFNRDTSLYKNKLYKLEARGLEPKNKIVLDVSQSHSYGFSADEL